MDLQSNRLAEPTPKLPRSSRWVVVCAAAALLAGVAGVFFSRQSNAAPDVSITTLSGVVTPMAALRGKVVLVNFWATTCTICRHEMPKIVQTYNDYAARGFEVIAVAMPYDRPDWVLDYSQRSALPFKVAIDFDGKINRAFGGIDATPVSFLIDRRGKVVEKIVGEPDVLWLRRAIERALARLDGAS